MSMSKNKAVVSNSWSRSPREKVEINHVWTIEGFSLRKEDVLCNSTFYSPQDELTGNKKKVWRLEIHPNGDKDSGINNYKEYLSVYLSLMTPKEIIEVNHSFSIHDEKGKCLLNTEKSIHTFGKPHNAWGYSEFCKRDEIIAKLSNDVLKITCKLSYSNFIGKCVSGMGTEGKTSALEDEPGLSLLSDNFGILLTEDEFSDVTLCVGEEEKAEFRAHRNILAVRCPYFAAMFKNEMKEKRENRVEIKDVKPEIFKEILGYIYTGKTPKNVTKEVLVAADFFALLSLKNATENVLVSKLTVGNAPEMLVLAHTHSAEILKTRATDFVAENLKEVMETEGWKMMMQEFPHLTKEPILRAMGAGRS